jgi:hypothetical protein
MEMCGFTGLESPGNDTIWAQESFELASGIYELGHPKGNSILLKFSGPDEVSRTAKRRRPERS